MLRLYIEAARQDSQNDQYAWLLFFKHEDWSLSVSVQYLCVHCGIALPCLCVVIKAVYACIQSLYSYNKWTQFKSQAYHACILKHIT